MKTKFKVDIHKNGVLNDNVLRIVANHNGGKVSAYLGTILQHLRGIKYEYPILFDDLAFKFLSKNSVIVLENGEPTITIEEVCLYELAAEPEANDLKEVNI